MDLTFSGQTALSLLILFPHSLKNMPLIRSTIEKTIQVFEGWSYKY